MHAGNEGRHLSEERLPAEATETWRTPCPSQGVNSSNTSPRFSSEGPGFKASGLSVWLQDARRLGFGGSISGVSGLFGSRAVG